MEDFFALEEGAMQMDAMEEEHEPAAPVSFIDFFARDNEVDMVNVNDVLDQSDIEYTDFFGHEILLNDQREERSHNLFFDFVTLDNETEYEAEQSHTSFIDFVPLDNQINYVAEQSDFLYYDFFNGGNQMNAAEQSVWNNDYYAQENQLNDGVNVVEQSVQAIDDYATEDQVSAAANVVEQSVQDNAQLSGSENVGEQSGRGMEFTDIADQLLDASNALERLIGNMDYYALEYEPSAAEIDAVEQLVQDINYVVLENPPDGADNVGEQSLQIGYFILENQQIGADGVINLSVPNNDVIRESYQDIDYYALIHQLRTAAYVYDQAVLDNDYTALETRPIVQRSGFNIRVMGENGEMGPDHLLRGLVVRLRDIPELQDDSMSEAELIDDNLPFVVRRTSRSVVRNLASVIITQESVETDTVTCAVCGDDFNVGETAKKLACSHYYHEDCILPWLDLRNTCPACRYELPIDNGSDDERQENQIPSPQQGQT